MSLRGREIECGLGTVPIAPDTSIAPDGKLVKIAKMGLWLGNMVKNISIGLCNGAICLFLCGAMIGALYLVYEFMRLLTETFVTPYIGKLGAGLVWIGIGLIIGILGFIVWSKEYMSRVRKEEENREYDRKDRERRERRERMEQRERERREQREREISWRIGMEGIRAEIASIPVPFPLSIYEEGRNITNTSSNSSISMSDLKSIALSPKMPLEQPLGMSEQPLESIKVDNAIDGLEVL